MSDGCGTGVGRWLLLVVWLMGCHRNPIGPGISGGDPGTSADGGGDTGPARTGTDGVCGAELCAQGQQCCLSTGKCVAPSRVAQDCPPVMPKPAVCGGVTCAADQVCCLVSGQCIDPATAATTCAKPAPPDAAAPNPRPAEQTPCASHLDCLPAEFCQAESPTLCLGPGVCVSRSNCGSSSGTSVCGCDGVTYPNVQSACRAGVRPIGFNACGMPVIQGRGGPGGRDQVIYCGTSAQCPAGQQCCALTARCYDASAPYLCSLPPPGTSLACLEDRHCAEGQFCRGAGCSGPGGCVFVSSSSCNGELNPVCGCDGKSYTNAGCAQAASVRVAHDGTCGAGDGGL